MYLPLIDAAPPGSAQPGPKWAAKGMTMLKNFDDLQKFGTDGADVVFKQFGAVSKAFQAIATEVADYSKHSFEATAAAAECGCNPPRPE